jgi:tetrapyrrole methylase family protein/MazG family protein
VNAADTEAVKRLVETVAALRAEGGCPWDREQTLQSLKPFLLEETHELIDAIDDNDVEAHREELGDVLLQVLLQAQIRSEQQSFGFADVARTLTAKLVRRHPHVFGDTQVSGTGEVLKNWEAIKAGEKNGGGGEDDPLARVPRSLPALCRAQQVQRKAARTGFDWQEVRDVLAKVREEVDEVDAELRGGSREALRDELGDLLFAIVNLCRFLDVDAEDALQRAVHKFTARFGEVRRRLNRQGRALEDCTLAEMDAVWDAVKRERRG